MIADANLQTQQRKNLKAMKSLVQNLNRLPLAAKIKGNRVSVEETNTQKANDSQNKSKRVSMEETNTPKANGRSM
jgi:hypothetical protein